LTRIGAVQPEIREQHNHVFSLLSWTAALRCEPAGSAAVGVEGSAYDLNPIRSRMGQRFGGAHARRRAPAGHRRAPRHSLGQNGSCPVIHGTNSMTEPERLEGFPGRYWHRLEDGRIQCDICQRYCRLNESQRGVCFVRGRQDDRIVLTTYGRSSGFCVDPIEKKPLNHFLPGTPVLSFGTAGCNLACKFCQNWDISKSRETDTLADQATPEGIASAARRLGCASVAFTYNDPVIFLEYAVDVAQACHEIGIRTVAVTAGEICPEPRVEFFRHMDAANVDLKGFTEEFYRKICGGELAPVLDTLKYLKHETDVWFEITTLLIPGENDSDRELDEMTRWVAAELGPDV